MLKQLHWSVLIIPLAHCGVKKQSAQISMMGIRIYSWPASFGQAPFNDVEVTYLLFQLGKPFGEVLYKQNKQLSLLFLPQSVGILNMEVAATTVVHKE